MGLFNLLKKKDNFVIIKRVGQDISDAFLDGKHQYCECIHGKRWPEGDKLESQGGGACDICCGNL